MAFILADGTEPPKIEVLRHHDSFYKTSEGRRIETQIDEYVHKTIRVMFAKGTEDWEFYTTKCLMQLVAQRETEGWELVTATEFYASMRKVR